MTETLVALLAAHALADFAAQTDAIVAEKHRVHILALHGVTVLALTLICLGGAPVLALAVAGAHLAIDVVKAWLCRDRIGAFLIDQGAHLVTLLAAAALRPGAWASGLWVRALPEELALALPHGLLSLAGLILAGRAGGFAVALFLQAHGTTENPAKGGLPGGGRDIGLLERALVFLLV